MQQSESASMSTGNERKRVEMVVETQSKLHNGGETASEIAHDARNMVTALGLYCDLLDEPGVLAPEFAHYSGELRLVAAASRRLVEKLVALDGQAAAQPWRQDGPAIGRSLGRSAARLASSGRRAGLPQWDSMPSLPVASLASELLATRNLLAALSGPSIGLTLDVEGGALPAHISGEDLTRVLVNLVKNAVEAMPSGGLIQIVLRERIEAKQRGNKQMEHRETLQEAAAKQRRYLVLSIEDSGPGIPAAALENIFASGYSGHGPITARPSLGSTSHQGLGLSISRSIVEAAGGRLYAENRAPCGARLVMELPVVEN